MRLQGQSRDARQTIAQNDAQAREMRDKAQVIRRSIDKEKLAVGAGGGAARPTR